MEKVQPIEGFKVMDWLRDVREKDMSFIKKTHRHITDRLKRQGKDLEEV